MDEDEELAYNLSTVNGGGSGAGEHQDVNRAKLSVGGGSRKLRKRLLHRSCGRRNVERKKSDFDSSPLKEDMEKSEIPQLKAQCVSEAVLAKEVLKFISPKESDEECELVSPGLSNEEDLLRKGFPVLEDLVNSPGRYPLAKKKRKTAFSPRGNKGGIRSPQKVIPEEQDESSLHQLRTAHTAKGSPDYKSPKSNLKSSSSLEMGSANKQLTGRSPKETLLSKSDTHSLDNSTKKASLRSDALSVDNSLKKTLSKKRDEQCLENSNEKTPCEKSDVMESVDSVHKKNVDNKIDILIKDKTSSESDSNTIVSESQEVDVWEGQQTAQDKVSSPRVLRSGGSSRRNSSASEYSSAAENKNSNPPLSSTEEQSEDNISVDAENLLDATRNPKIVVYSDVSELTRRRVTEEKAKVKLEMQQSLCKTPTRRSTRLSLAKGVLLGSPMASPSTSSARTSTRKRTRLHENVQNASPTPRRTRGRNNMQNASPATTSRKTRLQTTGVTLSTEDSSSQALRSSVGELCKVAVVKLDKATRELFQDKEMFQVENASDKENTSVKEKPSTTTGYSMIHSPGRLKHTDNPSKGVPVSVVVRSSPPPKRCIQEINISSPQHSKLNTQESNLPESSVERKHQTAASLQSTIEDSNVTGRRPRLCRRDVTYTPKR